MAMANGNTIHVLPKDVVDKIAAGEVVQRAAAALKEMVENSLDAHATEIHVVVHSISAFTLTDNGDGIRKDDLALACTRHATSKLRMVDDLANIASFGFRGEALASISMVAQVEIHSRTRDAPVGYTLRYANGRPITTIGGLSSLSSSSSDLHHHDNHHPALPTASARKVGTTIRVTNLFHNMPTRQNLRFANEYAAMLKVLQCYAVHYPTIAFVCQKADKPADLLFSNNNNNIQPTRSVADTASALFGLDAQPHAWLDHARELHEPEGDGDNNNNNKEEGEPPGSLIYRAQLYISGASSSSSTSSGGGRTGKVVPARLPFLLFVNDRLVSNTVLQSAVEQVISDHSHSNSNNNNKKSFVYLSIHVPAHRVDVNVHPTKQSVVLYHLDRIATDLAESLKYKLVGSTNVTTMMMMNMIAPKHHPSVVSASSNKNTTQPSSSLSSLSSKKRSLSTTAKRRASATSDDDNDKESDDDDDDSSSDDDKAPAASRKRPKTTTPGALVSTKKNEPKIRMNSNAGALDSFIVPKPSTTTMTQGHHHPSCPVDLSQPGAFALKDCRCADIRCPPVGSAIVVKPLTPTPCLYSSIRQLRHEVGQKCHADALKRLRQAAYVGPVSPHRSLLQIGPDLVLWSHTTAATHLFRQLALYKFGDCPMASLPAPGIDIGAVIAHLMQVEEEENGCLSDDEDDGDHSPATTTIKNSLPSESNQRLAQQATACLIQNKDMLLKYFAIRIDDETSSLTGLPILLDGHAPGPARLPLFLLRLATCVDYQQELACFDGVCCELGVYYGFSSSSRAKELFPAIRSLLRPPHEMELQPMTSLKECYKVFERC